MRWNYLSIPKLQRFHRWILGMDKLYNGCNYFSMLGLKLNHVSKRGHWSQCCTYFLQRLSGYQWYAFVHQVMSFNSSPPSAAYMRRWTRSALVQVMACRLFGCKPLHEPMLTYQLDIGNKLQWKLNRNSKLFTHENVFENVVCEMATILFRLRWVKIADEISWNINSLWEFGNHIFRTLIITTPNECPFSFLVSATCSSINDRWANRVIIAINQSPVPLIG